MTHYAGESGLWAIANIQFKTLPNNLCLVIRVDTGAVSLMDARWKPALTFLQPFRSLKQHLGVVVQKFPAFKPHEKTLLDLLHHLCRDGILVAGKQLAVDLAKPSSIPEAEPTPLGIAVTTCDRPQQLERLLASLLSNEREHGNAWRYQIVDDSRHPDSIQQNKDLMARYSNGLDLQYCGREARLDFLDILLDELPLDAQPLRWLLDSDDPSHAGQITYGCPKNFLILRNAGGRLILIDDDAVMKTWQRPGTRTAFRFGEVGQTRDLANDIQTLTATLKAQRHDPIGEHAKFLGRGLAAAIHATRVGASMDDLFGLATLAHLPAVDRTETRIKATMNALVGDPGTADDISLLYRDQDTLRASANDAAYRRLLSLPRCVFNGQPWSLLTNQGYFLLATMAGIDLGPYFPPLMPAGRGEDTMIACFLEHLFPADLALVLPWAMEHLPDPPRPWRITPEKLVEQLSPAVAWYIWAASSGIGSSSADPRVKLEVLKSHILGLAATMAGRDRLRDQFNAAIKQNWAYLYGELARTFNNNQAAGQLWRVDMDCILVGLQQLMASADVVRPEAMAYLIEQNRRYFEAIDAWNRAYALVSAGLPASRN